MTSQCLTFAALVLIATLPTSTLPAAGRPVKGSVWARLHFGRTRTGRKLTLPASNRSGENRTLLRGPTFVDFWRVGHWKLNEYNDRATQSVLAQLTGS